MGFRTGEADRAKKHEGTVRVNACSPGFTLTGLCKNYTGDRKPKAAALGASVVEKVLFTDLGRGATGKFFKEASAPGTDPSGAVSRVDAWVQ